MQMDWITQIQLVYCQRLTKRKNYLRNLSHPFAS